MEDSDILAGEDRSYSQLARDFNKALDNIERASKELERAKREAADELNEDRKEELLQEVSKRVDELTGAHALAERLDEELKSAEALKRAKSQFTKITPARGDFGGVKEPDMYTPDSAQTRGVSFMRDLYFSTLKSGEDPAASERIHKHQAHEIEKRAVTTSTLGGIIPPAYLIDLYAKASRNGRVYADQANNGTLPDVGMSVVVPRLTVGLTAGVQATQNTALTTSDPTEVDLSVPVVTIGGYSPVSRQSIERAAYSDTILFEDLIARYWALLDTQCISGSGSGGNALGVLNTSGISTSTASTATVAGVYPKIADVIQQINVATGGLGYTANKIIMHPRRWGFFEAALDTSNRPLIVPAGGAFNQMGVDMVTGNQLDYGLVGSMHGLPVYTDANIPTNLGASTNEDRIIVEASQIVHLFERPQDPVTLSFEQQAGTSLQVQLIAYGYLAFTAGRYPAASGVVSGVGLVPPTF